MSNFTHHPAPVAIEWLHLDTDDHGRKVHQRRIVLTEDVKSGKVIERVPVAPIYGPEPDGKIHAVHAAEFGWELADEHDKAHPLLPVTTHAIAYGYVGLYTHSPNPTAKVVKHLSDFVAETVATRDLEAGDVLTLDYGYGSSKDYRLGPVDAFLRPTGHPSLLKAHLRTWLPQWQKQEKRKQEQQQRAATVALQQAVQKKRRAELALAEAEAALTAASATSNAVSAASPVMSPQPRAAAPVAATAPIKTGPRRTGGRA